MEFCTSVGPEGPWPPGKRINRSDEKTVSNTKRRMGKMSNLLVKCNTKYRLC